MQTRASSIKKDNVIDFGKSANLGVADEEPHRKRIKWALEQARRDLVDPSRNNKLLHAPLSGKRPWCLAVTGPEPDEILKNLYRDDAFRGYVFHPKGDEAEKAEQEISDHSESDAQYRLIHFPSSASSAAASADNISRAAAKSRPGLQTQLILQKLEKRLTKIFRDERTLEEEQGLSTLFLAVGFLKWFDDDNSQEASYAPLILIPATLVRVHGKDGYLLRGRDADIVVNVSLREKLQNEFGIKLPDIPDTEDWKPSDYFAAVGAEISRQPRWTVHASAVGLGFFSFSKFMMWRDLDASIWPNGGLLDNAILNALLGDDSVFDNEPSLANDDESIDKRIDLATAIYVVDADSSQAIVVEETRQGHNLVVQGPPGTGKSQTITNIIASAVHAGKSVLFVAEKAAALDVVYDRLKRAGLGTLCLEIHSRKANKREVLKSLEELLRLSGASRFDALLPSNLVAARDKLNSYSEAIHKPIGQSGRSAFDVMGTQLNLRGDRVRLLDERLDAAADWDAEKLSTVEHALDGASASILKIGCQPHTHAWFATNIEPLSPFDQERIASDLRELLDRLNALHSKIARFFVQLSGNRSPSIEGAHELVQSLRHLATVPIEPSILSHPAWATDHENIKTALECAQEFARHAREVDQIFLPEAWRCDVASMILALRADGASFLGRLSARYRQANTDLRALLKTPIPKQLDEKLKLVELLRDSQQRYQAFVRVADYLRGILGQIWSGVETPWDAAFALAEWCKAARCKLGGERLITLAANSNNLDTLVELSDELESLAGNAQDRLLRVIAHTKANTSVLFQQHDIMEVPIGDLITRLNIWLEAIDDANDWVKVRQSLDRLRAVGLSGIAARLETGDITPHEVRPATDLLISEALWKRATKDDPSIAHIDGSSRSAEVASFRELDRRRIQIAQQEVVARYLDQRPNGNAGEVGIIKGEIGKKRGHRPVRKLIKDAGDAVMRLKPVFLMSPLSVAQFLPPGQLTFDILVIDEASQISPEEALGAIGRARQVVIVGDHKQLPPTNFFKTVSAGSDDTEGADEEDVDLANALRPSDYESILTLARSRGMSERLLAWHYRSKHPSLIALSNSECYANRLLLPPSPFLKTGDFGLSLVTTPRGHYDRGGTSRDLIQAQKIAEAVEKHMREFRHKSLGIACLSAQQRDAVDDMIDKAGIRSNVEAFCPKGERLFVKNLEAIQGDERDVIYISVGYGVATNQSKPFLNFGPVSREGGERRLNVLASRARERCLVFSSITASDIPADHQVHGARMLRALLHYAETGNLSAGTPPGGDFDSPFEEAVARVIQEAGYHVHPQVGVSSFRIDLGVIDPARPGRYVLGVECDGATYHRARSARDRDRLRQQVLEGLGWQLHRIWSTDWFRNPGRETDRLITAIREAAEIRRAPIIESHDHEEDPSRAPEIASHEDEPGETFEAESLHEKPSNVEAYKEHSLSATGQRDLLKLPVSEIGRMALAVIEVEGPIHTDEIARRIREAFGLQKTGSNILAHVRKGLAHQKRAGDLSQDGNFWIISGRDVQKIRDRRDASIQVRKSANIAPSEFRLAIVTALSETVSISRDDLVVQSARLFGFDRTGPDLKQEIEKNISELIAMGTIDDTTPSLRMNPVKT